MKKKKNKQTLNCILLLLFTPPCFINPVHQFRWANLEKLRLTLPGWLRDAKPIEGISLRMFYLLIDLFLFTDAKHNVPNCYIICSRGFSPDRTRYDTHVGLGLFNKYLLTLKNCRN